VDICKDGGLDHQLKSAPRRTSFAKEHLATFTLGAASGMGGCDDSVACVAADADRLRPIVHRDDTDGCVARDRPSPNDLNARGYASSRLLLANRADNATVVSLDMFCTGKDSGEFVVPDNKGEAIFLRLDRNGDGNADAVIFDFQRRKKMDLSFWDEDFKGRWTLVGYHDDGSLKPTRFESYAEFQRRMASR
jgi:hypothetical protein